MSVIGWGKRVCLKDIGQCKKGYNKHDCTINKKDHNQHKLKSNCKVIYSQIKA